MTYEEARAAIVGRIEPAWATGLPSVPLYWENALRVNLDAADIHARVEIDFDDAKQIDLSLTPSQRVYGSVYFTIMIKDGLGSTSVLSVMDFITGLMRFQAVSGVVFQAVRPGPKKYKDGWRSQEVYCPFWFDSRVV